MPSFPLFLGGLTIRTVVVHYWALFAIPSRARAPEPHRRQSETANENEVLVFERGDVRCRMCRQCGGLGIEYGCAWVRMESRDLRYFRRLLTMAQRSAHAAADEPVFIGWERNGAGLCLRPPQVDALARAVDEMRVWTARHRPATPTNTQVH